MPNLCPKNHDKDIVGVTPQRRCRECQKEWNRLGAQRRRARAKTQFRYPKPQPRVKPATDGYEDLYGPVPDLVPDAEWFDEVIVLRALNKEATGRTPYPLEWAEIIRRMPRADVIDADVADATGTTVEYVSRMRGDLNDRRSFLLATGGV
jgi:hypothetical protein